MNNLHRLSQHQLREILHKLTKIELVKDLPSEVRKEVNENFQKAIQHFIDNERQLTELSIKKILKGEFKKNNEGEVTHIIYRENYTTKYEEYDKMIHNYFDYVKVIMLIQDFEQRLYEKINIKK